MGAGNFPAGSRGDLAGLDPQIMPTVVPLRTYPQSLAFDPSVRGYAQITNSDGSTSMASIDTTDAAVALALGIAAGSVGGAPTFGHKLRTVLDRIPLNRQQTVAYQEVSRVLAPLISTQAILLRAVFIQSANGLGQIAIGVSYQNLRAPGQPVRPTVNL